MCDEITEFNLQETEMESEWSEYVLAYVRYFYACAKLLAACHE